ncbi:hypothetical protein ABZ897_33845 [Nonomuraea sp. NPDC046802]
MAVPHRRPRPDCADARIHLLDGGHFLLESALDDVTALVRDFLDAQLRPR